MVARGKHAWIIFRWKRGLFSVFTPVCYIPILQLSGCVPCRSKLSWYRFCHLSVDMFPSSILSYTEIRQSARVMQIMQQDVPLEIASSYRDLWVRGTKTPLVNFSVRQISISWNYLLESFNHFHICQVPPQLSCGDISQIGMWYSIGYHWFRETEISPSDIILVHGYTISINAKLLFVVSYYISPQCPNFNDDFTKPQLKQTHRNKTPKDTHWRCQVIWDKRIT